MQKFPPSSHYKTWVQASKKSPTLFPKDWEIFKNFPENVSEMIQSINIKTFDEYSFHPNNTVRLLNWVQQEVDSIMDSKRYKVEQMLTTLREFVWGYFSQMYLRTSSFISVCNAEHRILSNIAFQDFTGKHENPAAFMYNGSTKAKVNEKVSLLLSGKIAGYREIFELNGQQIAWTTLRVPYSKLNIRFGFIIGEKQDYKNYYQTEIIENCEINPEDFYFLKSLYAPFKEYEQLADLFAKDYVRPMLNQVKFEALILDYMLKFHPCPIGLYKGKKPVIFSQSFCKVSGYSLKTLLTHPDVTQLLHKWNDLQEVKEKLSEQKEDAQYGSWYDNIPFTQTNQSWQRLSMPWSNHLFIDPKKDYVPENPLSVRIADISQIEILPPE